VVNKVIFKPGLDWSSGIQPDLKNGMRKFTIALVAQTTKKGA